MIVRISTTEREYRNTYPGVKKMFEWIDETMKESQADLSHLVVNGVEVIDAPLDYVKKNLKNIDNIEVFPLKKRKPASSRTANASSVVNPVTIHAKISNIEFEVEKTPAGLDEMFLRIDESMKEFQVYFSHLIVDGTEVTVENPRMYIEDNLETINEIETCFLTADQLLQQVTQIMDNFLQNSLPTLRVIVDEFYGRPDDETWRHFETNIQGIAAMLQLINSVVSLKELSGNTETFAELGDSIAIHLENLQNAARLEDYTMMADILHFELVPFLENLHTAVSEMVRRYGNVSH